MAISKKIVIFLSYFLMGGILVIAIHPRLIVDGAALIFCYAFPTIVMAVLMMCEMNRQEDRASAMKIRDSWLRHLLVLYCLLLVAVLFFYGHRSTTDIETVGIFSEKHFQTCNAVPFRTLTNYVSRLNEGSINFGTVIKNVGGNFVLFMPLGFFFCTLLKKKVKSWYVCMLYTLMISFAVEVLQFVTFRGVTDIDDIILNCAGTVFSYLFFNSKLFGKMDFKQYFHS